MAQTTNEKGQRVFTSTKDNRADFASSVVADMESYASKHGLFLGKKEYTDHNKYEYFGDLHEEDILQLSAILFSGIVSAINNLEYVVIYNSYAPGIDIAMVKPDYREHYAEGTHISWVYGGDEDHDCMFGNEFRGVSRARSDLEYAYREFGNLVSHKWTDHFPEGALDGLMKAFRECEEKHVRRTKNYSSLDRKKDRIQASEDSLPTVLDLLAPMVGGKDVFDGYTRTVVPSQKYPVYVGTAIATGVKGIRVTCSIYYTAKRDKFQVSIYMQWAEDGVMSICGEPGNWTAEGSLGTIARQIRYAVGFAKLYDDTKNRLSALHKDILG